MSKHRGHRWMAFTLVGTSLTLVPRLASAQDFDSPLPPRTYVGAGIGVGVRSDDPFTELDGCSGRRSGVGSAALDVGIRLSRWLSAEVSGAKHFPFGEPIVCPALPLLPRPTGADTLSRATSYYRADEGAFSVRLAVPITWRYASARLFAGVVHVDPTRRTGATVGGALSAGGLVRIRLEVEQWLLPSSRHVEDVFYLNGREVGRRDRLERANSQPMFVRLGVQVGR